MTAPRRQTRILPDEAPAGSGAQKGSRGSEFVEWGAPRPGDLVHPSTPTIRLFAMDVDGTLTDGRLTLAADGGEWKTFHARDGYGIRLLASVGITPAIISGRASPQTERRARELGIEEVHQGVRDKAAAFLALCERLGLEPAEAGFMGDDLSDIPAMHLAGYAAAPADAVAEARAAADFTADLPGGSGAVRQAVEDLLRREGLWQQVLEGLTVPRTRQGSA